MITGMTVTQEGLTQKWRIGEELKPMVDVQPDPSSAWPFPKRGDDGLIYRYTHNQYVYRLPDGRIFEAWTVL